MANLKRFITAPSNRVFAAACGLLVRQLVLVRYSYSTKAKSILMLNGKAKPNAVGVYEARWVVFLMADPPVPGEQPFKRRGFLGADYVAMPGVYSIVLLHMAWTLVPTGTIVGLGGKKRLVDWRSHRQSIRRQRQGLCVTCGYDLRAARHQCPECGALLPDHEAALPLGQRCG